MNNKWHYKSYYERSFGSGEPYEVHEFNHDDGRSMSLYDTEDYLNNMEQQTPIEYINKCIEWYESAKGRFKDNKQLVAQLNEATKDLKNILAQLEDENG